MQVWKETSRSGVRSDMCIRRRNRCSEREELRYSERNQYDQMKRMTATRRSVSTQGNTRRGAIAVRENRLRGQRPPHLPGSRAADEWLHDAARAVDGSAAVRPLRAALRCTGGGVDGRRAIVASHSPLHTTRLLYAIVPWRDIILSPTLRGRKEA